VDWVNAREAETVTTFERRHIGRRGGFRIGHTQKCHAANARAVIRIE
jgi:hypothetical protein